MRIDHDEIGSAKPWMRIAHDGVGSANSPVRVDADEIGSAKTLMFMNCSPSKYNIDETIMSLKWATRAKKVTNAVAKQK